MRFLTLVTAIAAPFLPLVAADNTPLFPVATISVPLSVASHISADVSAYVTSVIGSPAYTSAASALSSANLNGEPIMLAQSYFTATATPDWFGQLPTPVQSFIQSVASAEASIAAKDSGADGSRRADGAVLTSAVVAAAAAVVGLLML